MPATWRQCCNDSKSTAARSARRRIVSAWHRIGHSHAGRQAMMAALVMDASSPPERCHALELFAIRADEIAGRVRRRQLPFIDGVDMVYSAAIWSGLADHYGDDAVQQVLAAAFAN